MKRKIFSYHKGTTRNTLLIIPLNLAIKFPQSNPLRGLIVFWRIVEIIIDSIKGKETIRVLKINFKYELFGHYERPFSLAWYWFRGIWANINEFRYFVFNYKNPLLVPTYFSFF